MSTEQTGTITATAGPRERIWSLGRALQAGSQLSHTRGELGPVLTSHRKLTVTGSKDSHLQPTVAKQTSHGFIHVHTHAHARMHTHTHTYTNTHTHAYTNAHMHVYTRTHNIHGPVSPAQQQTRRQVQVKDSGLTSHVHVPVHTTLANHCL